MTGGAVDAEPLQLGSDLGPGAAVLLGQAKSERAIGVTQSEGVDQLGVIQAARLEVGERLRARLQARVVVLGDLVEQPLILGIEGHRRGELGHRGALHHAPACGQRRIGAQHLHRVPERHPARLHRPVDRPAAGTAAEAVPQVLRRGHHQRGFVVLVERARPEQVLARFCQGDA